MKKVTFKSIDGIRHWKDVEKQWSRLNNQIDKIMLAEPTVLLDEKGKFYLNPKATKFDKKVIKELS